jgi:methionine-rich copper-binding protein CopC
MKKLLMSSALMLAITAVSAHAQVTKTIQGEAKTVTASVEAIERGTRAVTVKKPDGTYEAFYVPEGVKAFDTLKIGDKITAKYYENLVLRLKPAGEKSVDSASAAVVKADGKPAGTASHQQTITATITAIDQKVPSITFTGPRGWTYSTRVEDKAALAKVKVGDKVDITWTEAMILSLEPGK